jgi:hypothetical protein
MHVALRIARVAALAVASIVIASTSLSAQVVLDDFTTTAAWTAHPSDGVQMALAGEHGTMRFDFDFRGHAGYAIARRTLDRDLPPNYQFTFRLRGDAPVENLELKLIDASGDNVWWMNRRDFVFPHDWTTIKTKKRQVSFAWGPLGGGEPHHVESMELVVTAGSGGKGSLQIDDLRLEPLPPTPASPEHFTDAAIDLGSTREVGGLTIDWNAQAPQTFIVDVDGVQQRHRSTNFVWLPDAEARHIRIAGGSVRGVTVQPPSWAPTINDFFSVVAKAAPRGTYPRYLIGEQPYWTVIGADGADPEALIGEDGNVEPFKGGFSIEPFVIAAGKRITWADVTATQSLLERDLPMPTVTWKARGITLTITAAVSATSMLQLRYRLTGTNDATLQLAIRPFQVNPSSQWLNTTGGASRIDRLTFDGRHVIVNDTHRVATITPPTRFDRTAGEPAGYASGTLVYANTREVSVDVPLQQGAKHEPFDRIAQRWRESLHRVAFDIPAAPELGNTIRTNVAYMLINRDGAALEPGVRSYERAWIRDGALMAATLLRLGHADAAKKFAEWYAPHQFPSGKVPCCVDHRGADPVPENDSHGELIYLVAEIYRITGDTDLVRRLWPHVYAAAHYIEELRSKNHGQFEGLLTESISHEGYSAKPMHSYWDDLFGVRGLDDAARLAAALHLDAQQHELEHAAAAFRRDLSASIRRTIDEHHIAFVPGSAELGDFDATSTAIAISPLALADMLPARELQQTFDRYLASLQQPRADYTPYEMRIIGALIRLGRREDALPLIARFLRDRRPLAWNEWAEVVSTDARRPLFIGDMPHAWIASDFIRSMLDAFAFDDDSGTLIIGAGVDRAWLAKPLHVGPLPTYSGTMNIRMRDDDDRAVVELSGTARARRIVVRSPDVRPIHEVTINGAGVAHAAGEVLVTALPAKIVFSY